jgi:hypothetical protein
MWSERWKSCGRNVQESAIYQLFFRLGGDFQIAAKGPFCDHFTSTRECRGKRGSLS